MRAPRQQPRIDLRRRDRLLVTMDATIREVHHRVKIKDSALVSAAKLAAQIPGDGPIRADVVQHLGPGLLAIYRVVFMAFCSAAAD